MAKINAEKLINVRVVDHVGPHPDSVSKGVKLRYAIEDALHSDKDAVVFVDFGGAQSANESFVRAAFFVPLMDAEWGGRYDRIMVFMPVPVSGAVVANVILNAAAYRTLSGRTSRR